MNFVILYAKILKKKEIKSDLRLKASIFITSFNCFIFAISEPPAKKLKEEQNGKNGKPN